MALERSVIRWLYGRPLETLLATWGLRPDPDPGGAHDLRRAERAGREPGVHVGGHPGAVERGAAWSRIYIVLFAAGVLAAMWLLLAKTRLGLFIRA